MNENLIKNLVNGSAQDVINPMPLQRALSNPQPFPVTALGDILAPTIKKIAEVIQAPIGICAQSVLAAVALATQGYADIEIDGRIVPLSVFFLTIGATGERKSAVDNMALHSHRLYQNMLRQIYEKNHSDWLKSNEAYEAAKKHLLNKSKTYEEKKRALESLDAPPLRPLDPIILTEEPTYEGLIKLLITGQPSIGLFSDEGGRFIGGYGMNNENLLKTAAGLCGLWDGKPISRVRAGESPIILAGKRVSFHLMVQPEVAQIMLSNHLLTEQGLMSRCLITWPGSTAGTRLYKEINLSDTEELKEYLSRINAILKMPFPLIKNKRNELLPRKILLSQEAKKLFIAFHDSIENNIGDNKLFSSIRGFANKTPEHALRLAGIVALFDDIHCAEISTKSMSSGIELATHYINEALRLHNSNVVDPLVAKAQKLLDWLHTQSKKEFALTEIYQNGPNEIREAKTARSLMNVLCTHGWVTSLENGLTSNNVHRKEAWRLLK